MSFGALKKMAKLEMVCGLPKLDHVEQVCEACLVGKQRVLHFLQQPSIAQSTL